MRKRIWMAAVVMLMTAGAGGAFAAETKPPAPTFEVKIPILGEVFQNNEWLSCRQRCDTGYHGCLGKDAKSKKTVAECSAQRDRCKSECDKNHGK